MRIFPRSIAGCDARRLRRRSLGDRTIASTTRFAKPRAELVDTAQALVEHPLTTVVAPAGSGKTTLLNAWYDHLAGRVVRVRLDIDPLHCDPTTFTHAFVAAVRATFLGFGRAALRALSEYSGRPTPFRSWMRR